MEKFLLDELQITYKVLRAADTELEGYKNAFRAFETTHPEWKDALNDYLAAARQSDALGEKMQEKYSSILETSLRRFHGKLPLEIQERFLDL